MKVQVSVIRSVHRLANQFRLAQVNPRANRQATAAAVQSVQAKVQVQAHQPVIQDQTASV
ncbi:hypothetical protein [Enterococcus sp. K18_3]|uniref:hypothetical protein n=1 Tax=Enterococcus sp. K18_3 TaxID=2718932 RepID=UPI001C8CAC5C|nr:hypothetical protein [Enterococcus sp. K18_3]